MKKVRLFISFLAVALVFAAGIGTHAQNKPTVRENYPDGKYPPPVFIDTPGDSCAGTGLEQHDGPIHGNGYTAFTDSVRMVILFHPASYPWTYTNVCMAFTRTAAGPTSHLYDIVVYDTLGSGGSPGSILQVIPGNTVSNIGIYPQYTWNSTAVTINVSSSLKAVYIGYRYVNSSTQAFYCTVDEQASTPLWPGFYATNITFPATWQTIQSVAGFTAYKCMAIRTMGSASTANLCEGFTSATFPPTGWTRTTAGSFPWVRSALSGFGVGSGSAFSQMYDAPSGENESLTSLQFTAAPSGSGLYFDMAYGPYPATQPYAQDSLIISASTDNGTTYTSLVRWGPLQMQTAPAGTAEFVPTSGQWIYVGIPIPTGTNKVQFLSKSQFGNDLYLDSTCVQLLTGVKGNGHIIPNIYSLAQNYPNPFNPTTIVKYGLPKAGLVKIVVYDILGREVRTLVDELKQAGTYEVSFDASSLASGVYFYKIEANDFVQSKKMLLVK